VDGCLLVLESTQIMGARPHSERAPIIMGARPHSERAPIIMGALVGGLVISSFSSLQLRVDGFKIRSR
jgi:hypothetical protein